MKFFSKNFKINKTWLILCIALGVGLLAALSARNYLSNQMAAIEARNQGAHTGVVVAKRELKRNEILSSETVAVRSVPVDFAHSNALMPGELAQFSGRALAVSVKPGELILWSMLEGKKVPTFSTRVSAGHRAITVAVDEINSISGLLEPGDRVDLMVTLDQKGAKHTLPLLQSVQVMATGQRSVDDPKSGERRQYSTVTLDTTPEQAHNLIVAREAGRITALLRNPTDTRALPGAEFDLATVLGRKSEDLKVLDPEARQVPVLYGGRGAKLPAEGLQLGQPVTATTASQLSSASSAPLSLGASAMELPEVVLPNAAAPAPLAAPRTRRP